MQTRTSYPGDLSDTQWQLLRSFFSDRKHGMVGRPREYVWREIVNGSLYLARTGCQWRHLPLTFRPT